MIADFQEYRRLQSGRGDFRPWPSVRSSAQQRIVNEFEKEGLVEFRPNPHHRRANLVVLTARGREIYEQADRLQPPWVNALSEGIVAEAFASGSKNRASRSRKTTMTNV